jgi:hypothetical protein
VGGCYPFCREVMTTFSFLESILEKKINPKTLLEKTKVVITPSKKG